MSKMIPLGAGDEYVMALDARHYALPVDEKIVHWRHEVFERLGFNRLQASAIACRKDVDREHVERLHKAGARPSQILAIVL